MNKQLVNRLTKILEARGATVKPPRFDWMRGGTYVKIIDGDWYRMVEHIANAQECEVTHQEHRFNTMREKALFRFNGQQQWNSEVETDSREHLLYLYVTGSFKPDGSATFAVHGRLDGWNWEPDNTFSSLEAAKRFAHGMEVTA